MVDLEKSDEKLCPYCAETIKAAAVRCRYCQSDLTDSAALTDTVPPPQPSPAEWTSRPPHESRSLLDSARLLAVLVVLCLVLAATAAFAWYRSENPADGQAPDGAITSSQARDAGLQAATKLTQKVLSYDWKTLDADVKASEAVLAPSFRSEYAETMAGVKAQTIKNQVKLTAAVVASSIVSATENKVEALVFVNQVTTAKGSGNQRVDQNRVRVTLTRDGGDWRVSKMDAF